MKTNANFSLALITGATGGLGSALSLLLAKKNIPLIITGKNQESLAKLTQQLSNFTQVQALPLDLSSQEDLNKLLQLIQQQNPDLVINNAGLGFYGNCISQPLKQEYEMLQVNISALTRISIESAKALHHKKRSGVILNISSIVAFLPFFPGFAIYTASKDYILNFTLSLDAEMSPYHIRVLSACPGQIDTHFHKKSGTGHIKPSYFHISKKKAALKIFQQIIKRKTISIFPFSYRLQKTVLSLMPKRLLKLLLSRYSKKISC